MSLWIRAILALSFFTMALTRILPQGEKSKLLPALRFLMALTLMVVLLSPILSLSLPTLAEWEETESTALYDPAELLLQKSCETMAESVRRSFPDATFTLRVRTDENKTPVYVEVEGDKADKIAAFLTKNFEIPAGVKTEEDVC